MTTPNERTARDLRDLAVDHAAYEIANGLREILKGEQLVIQLQGSERLHKGIRELALVFLQPPGGA